jgi:hypothetical protein
MTTATLKKEQTALGPITVLRKMTSNEYHGIKYEPNDGEEDEDDDDDDDDCHRNGYTVFKNHDQELVRKIKAVRLPEDSFEYDGNTSKIETDIDGQYICLNLVTGKRFVIDHEEYPEIIKNQLLNTINRQYPIGKYWHQNFGTMFGDSVITVKSPELEEGDVFEYNDFLSSSYNEVDFAYLLSVDEDGMSMNASPGWSSNLYCHFDTDGNYVNRNYNLDIERLAKQKSKGITKAKIIDKIKRNIPNVTYMYANDTWYTEGFAFKFLNNCSEDESSIGFLLEKHQSRGRGSYGDRARNAFKMPKDVIQVKRETILERILPIVDKFGLPE